MCFEQSAEIDSELLVAFSGIVEFRIQGSSTMHGPSEGSYGKPDAHEENQTPHQRIAPAMIKSNARRGDIDANLCNK